MADNGLVDAGMDPVVQEALLRDPIVQEAVREAGPAALNNKSVQDAIIKVCGDKFPSLVDQVAAHVAEWGSNGDLQQKAFRYASNKSSAVRIVGRTAQDTTYRFISVIEQGPKGIRFFAFIGGVGQAIVAACEIAASFLVLGPIIHPVDNVVHVYQFFFGLSTMLFEVHPSWVERCRIPDQWQNIMIDEARFITKMSGRGFSYIFIGSLWLFQTSSFHDILPFAIGLYMFCLGLLHVLISYGCSSRHIAQKLREGVDGLRKGTVILVNKARSSLAAPATNSQQQLLAQQVEEVELGEARRT